MQRTLRTALVVLALSAIALPAAASGTVIISDTTGAENEPGAWFFNRDASTSSPYAFQDGPSQVGDGSAYVLPIGANPSDKFIGEYFAAIPMADVSSFSYDFLLGDGVAASRGNQFYLNVYANFGVSDPNKFYDCRYNIAVSMGSTSDWTTVAFDPNANYPVATRFSSTNPSVNSPFTCPSSPAAMDTISNGSTLRAFAINVGDTTVADAGVHGYLDNVVYTTTSGTTVFDFEAPANVPTSKDDCKKGGWETLETAEYQPFKNQGECVKYANGAPKAKGKK